MTYYHYESRRLILSKEKTLNRKAVFFLVATAFLNAVGIGLVVPVVPFLVQGYTSPVQVGEIVGALSATYAFCAFFASPMLGALSDRYGRRPLLLICLLGSAIGYAIFGLGGALWVLFLGRIVDGVTGGNVSILYASLADSTPPRERGRYYGMIGAASGIGFMVGPGIGALTALLGYRAPLFVIAGLIFINLIAGFFFFPETLPQEYRNADISLAKINPFSILRAVFSMAQLRWLLISGFLYSVAIMAFQTIIPVLGKDAVHWNAETIGVIFLIAGLTDIVGQGVIVRFLEPRIGDMALAFSGLTGEVVGFILLFIGATTANVVLIVASTFIITLGDALVIPSVGGLISQLVSGREQGRVQGGNLALQSITRIIGPLAGGEVYSNFGRGIPFIGAAFTVVLAILAICLSLPSIRLHQQQEAGAVQSPFGPGPQPSGVGQQPS
jgi:MFS transporter, DHA1 family, tetracycline resistance protein